MVEAKDVAGNLTVSDPVYFFVDDPNGGFATGSGLIDSKAGAYINDPSLSGKASLQFVSKYLKGATTPSSTTQFIFKASNLKSLSANYDWLVVAGTKAQFKGTGTLNDQGAYKFMLTAENGVKTQTNTLRIKIWESQT